MEEINKIKRSYYFCLLLMAIYVIVGIVCVVLYPQEIFEMLFFSLFVVFPIWPILLYLFIGVIIYTALKDASKRLDRSLGIRR